MTSPLVNPVSGYSTLSKLETGTLCPSTSSSVVVLAGIVAARPSGRRMHLGTFARGGRRLPSAASLPRTRTLAGRRAAALAAGGSALFLGPAVLFVDRAPRAFLGFAFAHAALPVAFLDVLGFAFLFTCIAAFVSLRHGEWGLSCTLRWTLWAIVRQTRTWFRDWSGAMTCPRGQSGSRNHARERRGA